MAADEHLSPRQFGPPPGPPPGSVPPKKKGWLERLEYGFMGPGLADLQHENEQLRNR